MDVDQIGVEIDANVGKTRLIKYLHKISLTAVTALLLSLPSWADEIRLPDIGSAADATLPKSQRLRSSDESPLTFNMVTPNGTPWRIGS